MSYKRRKTSDVPQRDTNRVTPVATEEPFNIDELPPELQYHIAELAHPGDVFNLFLASRSWRSIVGQTIHTLSQNYIGFFTPTMMHLKYIVDLRSLDFGRIKVPAAIYHRLSYFTNLESFRIHSRMPDECLSVLTELCPNLTYLNISGSGASESLLTLTRCEKLQHLYLDESVNIKDGHMSFLKTATNLKTLSLEDTFVTNETLKLLTSCVSLQDLNIAGISSREGDDDDIHLQNCTKLTKLQLDRTGFKLEPMLRALNSLTKMQYLDLSLTGIKDEHLGFLRKMPDLSVLILAHTAITDEGVATIAEECTLLQKLLLTLSGVTDECFLSLCTMVNLREVGLSGTEVTDGGIQDLQMVRPDIQANRSRWNKALI